MEGRWRSEEERQADILAKKLEKKKKFDSAYDGIEDNEELVAERS